MNIKNKKNISDKKKKLFERLKKILISLVVILCIYFVLYFLYPEIIISSLKYTFNLFLEVLKVLVFVFLFMIVFDLIIDENRLKKLSLKIKGIKGVIIASLLGIFSSGPLYVWYPFLENLLKKGIGRFYILIFMYTRAIKLQLIPIMLIVFDIYFVVLFFIFIFLFSIIESFIVDKILEEFA